MNRQSGQHCIGETLTGKADGNTEETYDYRVSDDHADFQTNNFNALSCIWGIMLLVKLLSENLQMLIR